MISEHAKHLNRSSRELIAFRCGAQEFCVNIMFVREIRGWTPATPMPHAPHYMLGVINLRGAVLPIIDLASRMGMEAAQPTVRHVIIVVQAGRSAVGLLVDAVSDVLTITDEIIQPIPDVASEFDNSFACGILAMEDRMICLIELEAVLPDAERVAA